MKETKLSFLRSQSGGADSKLPAILTIIVMTVSGFLAYKFIPVKVRNMKFERELQDVLNVNYFKEYKRAAKGGFNEYTMREKVMVAVKEFNIPITEQNAQEKINVQRIEGNLFSFELNYTEIIRLPIYGDYNWDFHLYLEQESVSGVVKK